MPITRAKSNTDEDNGDQTHTLTVYIETHNSIRLSYKQTTPASQYKFFIAMQRESEMPECPKDGLCRGASAVSISPTRTCPLFFNPRGFSPRAREKKDPDLSQRPSLSKHTTKIIGACTDTGQTWMTEVAMRVYSPQQDGVVQAPPSEMALLVSSE